MTDETIYEMDGVVNNGRAAVIQYGSGTCCGIGN